MNIRTSYIKCAICLCWFLTAQSFSQATHSTPPTTYSSKSYLKEATISESAGTVRIVANNPRPLAQILDALYKKYGWGVNYEDPQFVSKMDLVETKEAGKAATDSNLPSQLPAGGSFTVEFPSSGPVEEKVLQLAVDAYNRSDNPGRFELRSNKSGAFFIVGVKARDMHGQIASQSPVLDELIKITSRQRSVLNTVNLICQKVAAQRRTAVTLAVFPQRLLAGASASASERKLPARDLLYQALTGINRPCYWRLLYDPVSKGYYLETHFPSNPK